MSQIERAVPLILLEPGRSGRVIDVIAGAGLKRRLLAMGFLPGEVVQVVQNLGSAVLVRLSSGVMVVLSRGIAQKILVEPL